VTVNFTSPQIGWAQKAEIVLDGLLVCAEIDHNLPWVADLPKDMPFYLVPGFQLEKGDKGLELDEQGGKVWVIRHPDIYELSLTNSPCDTSLPPCLINKDGIYERKD
jgi:hypothetical protein